MAPSDSTARGLENAPAGAPQLKVAPPVNRLTKYAYGFGAVAFGVKENGFSYFLLLFYGTVIGLEPGLVGLAILIALILDAFSDPLVGYVSDNWHSKWGRRHPFMLAAAIPVSISFFALWNPPDWEQWGLFAYLLSLSIVIRTLITLYETPSIAMLAELTQDYEERTSLQSYRLVFGWVGGNLMTAIMFGFLLVATAEYPVGQLNREGYATYGVLGSLVIFVSIVLSAWGTAHRIPHMQPPPPKREKTIRDIFVEMLETLKDRSFFALFVASIFSAVAGGVAAALSFLMLTYFWEFSSEQIFVWTMLVFVSALASPLIAKPMVSWLGKKKAVIAMGAVGFTMAPSGVLMRLLGILPENGDPMLFRILVTINTVDLAILIALQAVLYSMVADLVEESQVKTGRRSEGVFFAAITFTRKTTQGIGAFAGGMILTVVGFPEEPVPGEVPPETLFNLGLMYAPTLLCLWAAMLLAIGFYKITKDDHMENVRKLSGAPKT